MLIGCIKLYLVFMKIGLFTIGGGLAALPLLQDELVDHGPLSQTEFIDMIAVSQSTPGPIGINMATYIGYHEFGVVGAFIATAGMVTPSLVIIILIARFMQNIAHRPELNGALAGLRPCAVGLIGAATWFIISQSVFNLTLFPFGEWLDYRGAMLLVGLSLLRWRLTDAFPGWFILIGAVAGMVLF